METYADVASLIIPPSAMQKILHSDAKDPKVAEEVALIAATSRTGERLFGWAMPYVVGHKCADLLARKLAALPKAITKKHIDELVAATITEGEKIDAGNVLNTRRQIKLLYRGMEIEVEVTSFHLEVKMRVAAYMKNIGMERGAIASLDFEAPLLPMQPSDRSVDDDIVKDYIQVRKTVHSLTAGMVPFVGAAVVDLLQQKSQATWVHGVLMEAWPQFRTAGSCPHFFFGRSGHVLNDGPCENLVHPPDVVVHGQHLYDRVGRLPAVA